MKLLALILFASLAAAQPVITRFSYGPPTNVVDGVEYGAPVLYNEVGTSNMSGAVSIDVTATITLTWTNCAPTNSYAVQSCPKFEDWRTPWVYNSSWMATTNNSLSFTQGCLEGQRFYRIIER